MKLRAKVITIYGQEIASYELDGLEPGKGGLVSVQIPGIADKAFVALREEIERRSRGYPPDLGADHVLPFLRFEAELIP